MILAMLWKAVGILLSAFLAVFFVITAELVAVCLKEVVHGTRALAKMDIWTLTILIAEALAEMILVSMVLSSVIGASTVYIFAGIVAIIVAFNVPFILSRKK